MYHQTSPQPEDRIASSATASAPSQPTPEIEPVLDALQRKGAAIFAELLQDQKVTEAQLTAFHQEFTLYYLGRTSNTGDQQLVKANSPFLFCWRYAFLYFIQGHHQAQEEDYDAAIRSYEKRISILTTIPKKLYLDPKQNTFDLVNRQSIARTYYEIGVLLYLLRKQQSREQDDSEPASGSEIESKSMECLMKAKEAYTNALKAYKPELPTQKFEALVGELTPHSDVWFSMFDQYSIRNTAAVIYFNLADILENIYNAQRDVSKRDQANEELLILQKQYLYQAYMALDKKADPDLRSSILSAVSYHKIAVEDKSPTKAKSSKKTSKAPAERTQVVQGRLTEISLAEGLSRFASTALPDNLFEHQRVHLTKIQQKLLAGSSENPVREAGIVSVTGSGKTRCVAAFLHSVYGRRDQRISTIYLVPSQSLVEQVAKAIVTNGQTVLPNLPNNESDVGKWYAAEKRLRPFTIITYTSFTIEVRRSLVKVPDSQTFLAAVAANPLCIWEKPEYFFSPFNKNMIIIPDEAHHGISARTYLATLAYFTCPDKHSEINAFFASLQKTPKAEDGVDDEFEVPEEKEEASDLAAAASSSLSVNKKPKFKDLIKTIAQSRMTRTNGCFIFPVTATPPDFEEYKKIFPVDSQFTLVQAVEQGYAPNVQVVEVSLSDPKLIRALRQRLKIKSDVAAAELSREQKEVIGAFVLELSSSSQILATVMRQIQFNKGIVFVQSVQHVIALSRSLRQAYSEDKEFQIGEMHSGLKARENRQAEIMFRQAGRGLLVNCRMAGEGSDFPDVDMVCELRTFVKATVPIMQAAGRAFRPKANGNAHYLWLNLGIGQIDPAEVLFGKPSSVQRCLFASSLSEDEKRRHLFDSTTLPSRLKFAGTESSEILFTVTDPRGIAAHYSYAGMKVEKPKPVRVSEQPPAAASLPVRVREQPAAVLLPFFNPEVHRKSQLVLESNAPINPQAAAPAAEAAAPPFPAVDPNFQFSVGQMLPREDDAYQKMFGDLLHDEDWSHGPAQIGLLASRNAKRRKSDSHEGETGMEEEVSFDTERYLGFRS